MPQVLRPNDYTNEETKSNSEVGTFEITKQTVLSAVLILILGAWVVGCYFNEGLFFKEAAACSSIIFFLLLVRDKSVKKEGLN